MVFFNILTIFYLKVSRLITKKSSVIRINVWSFGSFDLYAFFHGRHPKKEEPYIQWALSILTNPIIEITLYILLNRRVNFLLHGMNPWFRIGKSNWFIKKKTLIRILYSISSIKFCKFTEFLQKVWKYSDKILKFPNKSNKIYIIIIKNVCSHYLLNSFKTRTDFFIGNK